MSWFDNFLKDIKAAGYVRLLVDLPNPWGHYPRTGPQQHGNMEAFWYLNQTEPGRDKRGYRTGVPDFWELVRTYEISGGCGNGGQGVLQHQVTLIGGKRLPAGYYIYDFRNDVNLKLLADPIFSKLVDLPCPKCAAPVRLSKRNYPQPEICDSCLHGDA